MDYKEKLEKNRRKRNTFLFGILLTVLSIIITLVLMVALYVIMAFIIIKLLGIHNANVITVLTLLVFISSIVIEFIIYKPLTRFLILKLHLQDKLTKDSSDLFLNNNESGKQKTD